MRIKKFLILFALLTLFAVVGCSPAGGAEPAAEVDPVVEPTPEAEAPAEAMDPLTAADCPQATDGTRQLIDPAQGICFLFPEQYEAIRTDDGSLTLYVQSPMNTEAPLATVKVLPVDGRSIQELIPDYPSDAELATMSFLTIELGGEMATVLDILPGQDSNRRIFALHNDRLVDIMIARIGQEYGEVGQQAEVLFQTMTESFRFIAVDPNGELVGGTANPFGEPEPAADVDPFVLARQLVEQTNPAAPEGWQVAPCEGEAAVFCISNGQENVGFAELLIFPLSTHDAQHPARLVAETLPADPAAYTADQQTAVQQALTALAEEHLAVIADDRAITYPDDTLSPLPIEPAKMGGLPAVTFGFVHTNDAAEVLERYVQIAAFDRQHMYWLVINYDPANVSTFVSDTAVTEFILSFRQTAENLPLP